MIVTKNQDILGETFFTAEGIEGLPNINLYITYGGTMTIPSDHLKYGIDHIWCSVIKVDYFFSIKGQRFDQRFRIAIPESESPTFKMFVDVIGLDGYATNEFNLLIKQILQEIEKMQDGYLTKIGK